MAVDALMGVVGFPFLSSPEADRWPGNGVGYGRSFPDLKFAATVDLGLDSSTSVGETPDGVRLELRVHGAVDGPMLRGKLPPLAAHMLVHMEGIGPPSLPRPLPVNA